MKSVDEKLVEQIKIIGRSLFDTAPDIVSNLENKSEIFISFSVTPDSIPTINICTSFYPNTLLNYYKNNT